MTSSGVCLDVAIDHRIRQLLQPAINIEANPSDGSHLEKLEQLHLSVHDKEVDAFDELLVTKELAKPLSKGGLVVALIRPASNHPFADGVEVVVEESPTLRALRDVFALLGLDLINQVTVLDSLPFWTKQDGNKMLRNDEQRYMATLKEHYEVFLEAVVAKQPDVVLCMWEREGEPQENWSGYDIQRRRVGESFASAEVTLYDRQGNRIETKRVNAFHPGYCMNHNPEYSQFRQLLMLEITHACNLMSGGWREESWMSKLRERCKDKAKQLYFDRKRAYVNQDLQIPRLHSKYASAVAKIQDLIPVLASGEYDSSRYFLSKEALYHTLIDAKWTEHMNDASLCLKAAARELKRDIVDFHDTIDPQGDMVCQTMGLVMSLGMKFRGSEKMEVRNAQGRGFISETFTNSVQNEKSFSTPSSWFSNRALKRRMVNFLLDLNNAFLDAKEADDIQGPIRFQLSLDGASKAFLTMACGMEDLLGTLAAYLGELKVAKSNTEQHAEPDDGKSQIKATGDVSEESTTLVGDFEGLAL